MNDVDSARMTLIEHLTELRSRLVKCVLAVALGATLCFLLYSRIFHALVQPYCSSLSPTARAAAASLGGDPNDTSCKLYLRDPLEGFGVRMTVATYGGIALAMPVLLWQVWRFIAPGLYRTERRYASWFVGLGVALFTMGAGLAFWTMPRALQFLNSIGGKDLVTIYSPKPYLSLVTKMMIAFGLGFEFPLLLAFLQMVGVLNPKGLAKYRRHAVVGITVLVAIITPSGDPITLLVLTVPMCLFYEASIIFGKVWLKRRNKAHVAAGAPA